MHDSVSPVLITGAPGVGKTTVAAHLARRFPLAAHIEADLLHRMIVSGGQWPSAGTELARKQLILRTHNAVLLACSFQLAGLRPVVDEVVATTDQVAQLHRYLDIDSATIAALSASNEVIRERDAGREKHTAGNYLGIEASIRKTLGKAARWIDTTHLNTEQTVEIVAQHIVDRETRPQK